MSRGSKCPICPICGKGEWIGSGSGSEVVKIRSIEVYGALSDEVYDCACAGSDKFKSNVEEFMTRGSRFRRIDGGRWLKVGQAGIK